MVRRGTWKFNIFDGFSSQCFDLENDPEELNNLVGADAGERIMAELSDLARQGWDCREIRDWQDRRQSEVAIQMAWTRATQPEEYLRWYGRGEQDNYYE